MSENAKTLKRIDKGNAEEFEENLKTLVGLTTFDFKSVVEQVEFEVNLRIDPDSRVISGDIMSRGKNDDGPPRRTWVLSWRSEAVFLAPEGAVKKIEVIADVAAAEAKRALNGPEAKARIRFDPSDFTRGFEITAFSRQDNATQIQFQAEGNPTILSENACSNPVKFRRISVEMHGDLDVASEGDENNELALKLIKDAFNTKNKDTVQSALGDAGVELIVTNLGEETDLKQGGTKSLQDIVIANSSAKSEPDPWEFKLLFSKAITSDNEEMQIDRKSYHAEIPYGRTLGLKNGIRRFRNRFGAIVFVEEIIRKYCKLSRPKDENLAEFKKSVLSAGEEDEHYKRLRHSVLFTIVHEFGHMLNLPHPWHRDRFPDAGMTADPAAKSWMNYGSLFPTGIAQDYDDTANRTAEERAARQFARFQAAIDDPKTGLGAPKFTAEELLHIRHAFFDRIAVGQRTFVDSVRAKPAIRQDVLTANTALRLNIKGEVNGRVSLTRFQNNPTVAALEPFHGTVSFDVEQAKKIFDFDSAEEESLPLGFHFATGSLKLLMRRDRSPRHEMPSKTVVFEPQIPSFEKRIWSTATQNTGVGGTAAEPRIVNLPFVPPAFIYKRLNPAEMTVQAVYTPQNGQVIYSNPVTIEYVPNSGKPYPEKLIKLLNDRDLGLYAEVGHLEGSADRVALDPATKKLLDDPDAVNELLNKITGQQPEWLQSLYTTIRPTDGSPSEEGLPSRKAPAATKVARQAVEAAKKPV